MEIYSPAYLFNADGTDAVRPAITGVTPAFGYGAMFDVQTPDASDVRSVVLVRPGAQTHAFDMDQRLIELSFTTGASVLRVTAPPNGNIAPPGYYLLFILNSAGVPSVATFVQLSASIPNQAPTATITSPAANMKVDAGQSVFFSGDATDSDGTISAYSWTLPGRQPRLRVGRQPRLRAVLHAGHVRRVVQGHRQRRALELNGFANDYRSRFQSDGHAVLSNTSRQAPAPRTPQQSTAGTGFTGVVTFSVSGLPAGATATFAPSVRHRGRIHDPQRQHFSLDAGRLLSAGRHRDERTAFSLQERHPDRCKRRLHDIGGPLEPDPQPRRHDHVYRHDCGRTGILRNREPVREWRAQVRDRHVRPGLHRVLGHVNAHRGHQETGYQGNVYVDYYRIWRRSGAFDNRRAGGAMTAGRISRRSLLYRIGAGAALSVVPRMGNASVAAMGRWQPHGRADSTGPERKPTRSFPSSHCGVARSGRSNCPSVCRQADGVVATQALRPARRRARTDRARLWLERGPARRGRCLCRAATKGRAGHADLRPDWPICRSGGRRCCRSSARRELRARSGRDGGSGWTSGRRLVYLCNPNNPTASVTPRKALESFVSRLPRTTRIVIDEAYHHYVGGSSDYCVLH